MAQSRPKERYQFLRLGLCAHPCRSLACLLALCVVVASSYQFCFLPLRPDLTPPTHTRAPGLCLPALCTSALRTPPSLKGLQLRQGLVSVPPLVLSQPSLDTVPSFRLSPQAGIRLDILEVGAAAGWGRRVGPERSRV